MKSPLRRRILKTLRFTWVLLAVGFVVHFMVTRWTTVVELQRSLAFWQPIVGLALIVAGKLVYTQVVRLTLATVGATGGFREAFYAYNISQLGKYIPGSIWQFVGRYEIYRRYGVTSGQAFQIMVLENGLMLLTALLVGLGAAPVFADLALAFVSWPMLLTIAAGAVLVLSLVVLHGRARERILLLSQTLWRHKALVIKIMALFLAMWVLLGLSALAVFAGHVSISPLFFIALFAVSYVVGFAALFAPAGIGVRDIVFTIGLTGVVEPQVAILLTVGHRVLYILADFLCGLYAWATSQER
jgi:uncharacterized membrane protein YbhN (UPF0104 family)